MPKASATLDTALALRARGYAPHWLRPRSKVPIDKAWSVAPVMSAEALRASYQLTYNVGIILDPHARSGLGRDRYRCKSSGLCPRSAYGPW
jgi:hypothetical protein